MSLLNDRVSYVWLILALLTGLSWLLADSLEPSTLKNAQLLAVGLLALAFFKIRLVILYFMEIQNAPWVLRGLFEAWVAIVFTGMCFLYLTGNPG